MKAYVLHGIADVRYEETAKPEPREREALIRVKAAGICGSDIPRIYKTGAYHHPMIPGHEFSGQVEAIGAGVSEEWIGKRVGVFPLMPCMSCSACMRKRYEMCADYNYLGSRTDGGFAELVRVPLWNLIELPERVTYEQAAMLEPMAVAVHAIRQSGLLRARELAEEGWQETKIAVCGLGAIGLFVVMFLREMGYRNIYTAGKRDFQKDVALRLGIPEEYFCDTRDVEISEWLEEKTAGEGTDIFFECVGKNDVLTQGVNSLARGGTLLLVGNPDKDMLLEKNAYWRLLRRQITVRGTWNSAFTHETGDDWHYVLRLLESGRIQPEQMITHRFKLRDLIMGFEMMRDKSEDYIKVMAINEKE